VAECCGTNIVQELVDACADRAARACAPHGARTCKAAITDWSLIRGPDRNCTFTCWPPPAVAPTKVDYGNHDRLAKARVGFPQGAKIVPVAMGRRHDGSSKRAIADGRGLRVDVRHGIPY